jgi:hypothetical protein
VFLAAWLALVLCCLNSQRVLVLLVLHSTCVDMDVDQSFVFSLLVACCSILRAGGGSHAAYNMLVALPVRAVTSFLDRPHSIFLLTLVLHHEAQDP